MIRRPGNTDCSAAQRAVGTKNPAAASFFRKKWCLFVVIHVEIRLDDFQGMARLNLGAGDLVKDGLLVRRHGSGTFVAKPVAKVQQSLSLLTSFTEDMARREQAEEWDKHL